jgi:hypothetical protein
MPSSLIIVALVVAWLLVLVPIVARKRQEVARTADSTLAARVVHTGGVRSAGEDDTMPDADTAQSQCLGPDDLDRTEGPEAEFDSEFEDEFDEESLEEAFEPVSAVELAEDAYADADAEPVEYDDAEYDGDAEFEGEYDGDYVQYEDEYADHRGPARPYRPGRGGYDPEAAALAARAKYGFRQRIVVLLLLVAVATGVAAALTLPALWWLNGVVDIGLVGYLSYLRRQVRIENEIRQRRAARLGPAAVEAPASVAAGLGHRDDPAEPEHTVYAEPLARVPARRPVPGAVVVDMDDEDPDFDHLAEPDDYRYRRAVGE